MYRCYSMEKWHETGWKKLPSARNNHRRTKTNFANHVGIRNYNHGVQKQSRVMLGIQGKSWNASKHSNFYDDSPTRGDERGRDAAHSTIRNTLPALAHVPQEWLLTFENRNLERLRVSKYRLESTLDALDFTPHRPRRSRKMLEMI